MITVEVISPIITDINPNNKTISVAIDTVVKRDGAVISTSRERRAFVPGEIEEYKAYTGQTTSPEIDYLNAIWTQDVINAYQASVQ